MQAIVMAGGKGTRMNSDRPKLLHRLGDMSLVGHVLRHVLQYGIDNPIVVVCHMKEQVIAEVRAIVPKAVFAVMPEALGTGFAVQTALPYLKDEEPVLILSGDMTFFSPKTLNRLLEEVERPEISLSLAFANNINDRFGRVIRDEAGNVTKIVEVKDATPEELAVQAHNAGFYAAKTGWLRETLPLLKPSPVTHEYYLTELPAIAHRTQAIVAGVLLEDQREAMGVNTPEELQAAEAVWHATRQENR